MNEFNRCLFKEENILWEGKPETNIYFTKWDILFLPVSIIFILILFNTLTIKDLLGIQIIVLGPIIIFAVFFFIGRFFFKHIHKKQTIYYVTNKRIVVFNKSQKRIIRESDISSLKSIIKDIRNDGMGKIEFGQLPVMQMFGGNSGFDYFEKLEKLAEKLGRTFYGSGPMIPIFYDIREAESVYQLVNEIRRT